MANNRHESKLTKKRYTGIMKWLDTEGVGYIINGEIEVFVTPFSITSDTIKQGDKVSYSLKTQDSNEAVDVERCGNECYRCSRTGHAFFDCPDNVKYYWVNCYKCGLIGHYADNCDQKFYGLFSDKTENKGRCIKRSCNCNDGCWLSLFGGSCRKFGIKVNNGDLSSSSNLVLGSFGFYWPHLIESCFNCKKRYNDDDDDDDYDHELRYVVCVKKEEDVKKVEEVEDCFILEFDPNELPKLENLSMCDNSQVDDDVCILAEKGKVACRDYPHSRHLCATYSFENTPHESHCKMCYCYICDIPAPCKKWTTVSKEHCLNHCDASEGIQFWRSERETEKKRTEVSQRPTL